MIRFFFWAMALIDSARAKREISEVELGKHMHRTRAPVFNLTGFNPAQTFQLGSDARDVVQEQLDIEAAFKHAKHAPAKQRRSKNPCHHIVNSTLTISREVITDLGGDFESSTWNLQGPQQVRMSECRDLKRLIFPDDLPMSTIAQGMFQHFPHVESVVIGKSIEEIGPYAFLGCESLSSVTFADPVDQDGKLKIIGMGAFQRTALAELNVPASVEDIGAEAFSDCKFLREVNFFANLANQDGKLKKIGVGAFQETALVDVSIPASVERIWSWAFARCKSLNKVTFADLANQDGKLKSIDAFAFSESALTGVSLPASVKWIGPKAFFGCWALSNATFNLNSKLLVIEERAFASTAIQEVSIPDSVKQVPETAFEPYVIVTRFRTSKSPASRNKSSNSYQRPHIIRSLVDLLSGLWSWLWLWISDDLGWALAFVMLFVFIWVWIVLLKVNLTQAESISSFWQRPWLTLHSESIPSRLM